LINQYVEFYKYSVEHNLCSPKTLNNKFARISALLGHILARAKTAIKVTHAQSVEMIKSDKLLSENRAIYRQMLPTAQQTKRQMQAANMYLSIQEISKTLRICYKVSSEIFSPQVLTTYRSVSEVCLTGRRKNLFAFLWPEGFNSP
jgi:hypothetical protein